MAYISDQSTSEIRALIEALRPGQSRAFFHHQRGDMSMVEYPLNADRKYVRVASDGYRFGLSGINHVADYLRCSGYTIASTDIHTLT